MRSVFIFNRTINATYIHAIQIIKYINKSEIYKGTFSFFFQIETEKPLVYVT